MEDELIPNQLEERRKLLELERDIQELKHKLKMEELAYERENAKLVHLQILERGRIQRAEERKTVLLKDKLRVHQ